MLCWIGTLDGEIREVFDGLFTAANGSAGFWMWEVKDMDEAVECVKRSSNPMLSRSEVEIHLVFEYRDFGDAMTPELVEQEERMRLEIADRSPNHLNNPASAGETPAKLVKSLGIRSKRLRIPDAPPLWIPAFARMTEVLQRSRAGCRETALPRSNPVWYG